ncbi:AAA family ATPase [Phenylobacterium aquaticum]|uniref:AAA family ATPase n=1 Tax=Phenylobacterium aquaticum TaxID=1763816 RepID=UPI001F5C3F71|nr:AAA family ATPase [Phenylobacterium aquaticum]MCI3135598.1 AAA family ATPase [Phenylobacterium aquaticum]
MDGRLIIVTGPPGAGKSTLARAVAKAWPGPAALHLHSDDLWTYFVKGYIPPWTPASADQNRVVMEAMAVQAATLAAGGYPVAFDGIVGTWFLPPFREAADRTGVALDYLVLRPDRETTIAPGRRPRRPSHAGSAGHRRHVGPVRRSWRPAGPCAGHHRPGPGGDDRRRPRGLAAGRYRLA